MAIEAIDGGTTAQQKAYKAVIAAQKAVLQNPGNSPDAKNAKAILAKAQAAYDAIIKTSAKTSAQTNPDVLAAKQLQSEAQAEVASTQASIDALTAENQAVLSPEAAAAVSNLDTNEGLQVVGSGSSVGSITGSGSGITIAPSTAGKPTVYTASDGTTFTDQAAFATYAAMLAANARNDFDKAQAEAAKIAASKAEKADAFALIATTMKSYGFTDAETAQLLAFAETQIIDPNIGTNQAILNMRNLPVYQARFAGNKTRVASGANALSEADYLAQENSLAEYFKAWGLPELGTRDQYATLIGNSVSATETNKRLSLAVSNVKNADPNVLDQLKYYYPSISDKDLVTYFLNPKASLPDLQKKVTTAEISSAALMQKGLTTDMAYAERLTGLGVTKADAITGYQNVAEALPTSQKLSNIYNEADIKYNQRTAETEFLESNQDAAEKRKRLKSLERAAFQGESGITQGSGLARSVQGKF
jgi:hypothetical protein